MKCQEIFKKIIIKKKIHYEHISQKSSSNETFIRKKHPATVNKLSQIYSSLILWAFQVDFY
jgi:hypothetical protein